MAARKAVLIGVGVRLTLAKPDQRASRESVEPGGPASDRLLKGEHRTVLLTRVEKEKEVSQTRSKAGISPVVDYSIVTRSIPKEEGQPAREEEARDALITRQGASRSQLRRRLSGSPHLAPRIHRPCCSTHAAAPRWLPGLPVQSEGEGLRGPYMRTEY